MSTFWGLLLLSGSVIMALLIEAARHRRALGKLRLRIHVGGTRGKSSVTRLIAHGLNAAGLRSVAKTTGSAARYIDPQGREWPVPRPLGPSIGEQRDVVALAAKQEAEALVVECMALTPAYHWLLENRFIRATHAIITNIRPDHLDVMGPSEADAARAVASMIPQNGVLYTTEVAHLELLRAVSAERGTRLVAVGSDEVAAIGAPELAGFSYLEHAANVALALRILADFGLPRERALPTLWTLRPDPGAAYEVSIGGLTFVNAFAANDPHSTALIWQEARRRHPQATRLVALFCLRAERHDRSRQFAQDTRFWHEAGQTLVWGAGAAVFARSALRAGYPKERLLLAASEEARVMADRLCALGAGQSLVVGMGNIAQNGLLLLAELSARSRA